VEIDFFGDPGAYTYTQDLDMLMVR
jgi:hypothetical protein